MPLTYLLNAKTPTELQTYLMEFLEPKIRTAARAAKNAKTERERWSHNYEAAAYCDIWSVLNQMTFDSNVSPPRKSYIEQTTTD